MHRVLLAEDDDAVRTAFAQVLRAAGYEVTAVADGLSALRAVKAGGCDAVVTDIVMPHLDGLELIRLARRHLENVRVVAISGDGHSLESDLLLRAGGDAGADAVLRKPVRRRELIAAVAGGSGEAVPPPAAGTASA